MSCVLLLELYLTCEISNTTENVIFPWLGNLNEVLNLHKLRKYACQVTFPKYQITTVFVKEISL